MVQLSIESRREPSSRVRTVSKKYQDSPGGGCSGDTSSESSSNSSQHTSPQTVSLSAEGGLSLSVGSNISHMTSLVFRKLKKEKYGQPELKEDEADIAKLLAELSGHNVDLSSPKGSTNRPEAFIWNDRYDFPFIPLQRTSSTVSIGNFLAQLGRPRSQSVEIHSSPSFEGLGGRRRSDSMGLLPRPGQLGVYTAAVRKLKIERYIEKRKRRVWGKKIKYDVRKNFADSRVRVKGRFVRKTDETDESFRNERSNSVFTDGIERIPKLYT